MDKKTTSIIGYIGLIGFLIAYLAGDKEGAKFHLNQSLVVNLIGLIPAVNFVAMIFDIIGIINAVNDEEKPLPIIGGITLLK